jgi:hypothetical protein
MRLAARSLFALLALVVGCLDGGLFGNPGREVHQLFIGVDGGLVTTVVGGTLQLRPYGSDKLTYPVDVGPATWTSLDTNIATVSSSGLVKARAVGNVLIEGRASGKTDDVEIQVRSAWCGPLLATGEAERGVPMLGAFTTADCAFPGGGIGDGRILTVTVAETVRVAVDWGPVPGPTILVTNSTGSAVPRFQNSQVPYSVPGALFALTAGSYRVWVVSEPNVATGTYSLAVDAVQWCGIAAAATIQFDVTLQQELSGDDCVLSNGRAAELWALDAVGTRIVAASITTHAFYTQHSMLGSPASYVLQSTGHDGDSTITAILRLHNPDARFVIASGDHPEQRGTYRLRFKEIGLCEADPPDGILTIPDTILERLDAEDCYLISALGRIVDQWQFVLASPAKVRIDFSHLPHNSLYDAEIRLQDAVGVLLPLTEGFLGDYTTRRESQPLAAGTYRVTVRSAGKDGPYRLAVTTVP